MLPLFKQVDKSLSSNYRPVSLLSGIRNSFKHIYNHINYNNNLLYKYQSGFLASHSTTFKLILDIHVRVIITLTYCCRFFKSAVKTENILSPIFLIFIWLQAHP